MSVNTVWLHPGTYTKADILRYLPTNYSLGATVMYPLAWMERGEREGKEKREKNRTRREAGRACFCYFIYFFDIIQKDPRRRA